MKNLRCGITTVELLIGVSTLLLCGLIGVNAIRASSVAWTGTTTEAAQKETLARAVGHLEQDLRDGLLIDTDNSNAHQISFRTAAVDGNGLIQIPLKPGKAIEYYLSDKSGAKGVSGSILWKTVNGVAAGKWPLLEPNAPANSSLLTFVYYPVSDPKTVRITLQCSDLTGKLSAVETAKVLLRNHDL